MMNTDGPSIDDLKDKYIRAIFIDTADEDYVLARWLFFNRLHRHFWWSAAQSVEKYLKASLVLNGVSVKNYSHDIIKLFEELCSVDGARELIPEEFIKPDQVPIFNEIKSSWGSGSVDDFIARLAKHGDPNNRYDYIGIEITRGDLFKLDQFVFVLRNLSVNLKEFVTSHDGITKTHFDHIKSNPKKQLYPFSPKLADPTKASDEIYRTACDNNFPFAPKSYQHTNIKIVIGMTVSDLEILFKWDRYPIVQNWLIENVKLKPQDIDKIKINKIK